MGTWERELETGRAVARGAGEIALKYWRTGLDYESKDDDSPVTAADRECESYIARVLEETFPDDGILGEEGSSKPSRNGRRWIVDPIDGTRDFIRGYAAWATLLALECDGRVVVGIASLPAMGDLFTAVEGGGAFLNGNAIHASSVSSPSRAVLCVNDLKTALRQPFCIPLTEFIQPFFAVRSLGGCLDAMMVARGQADLWIEPEGKPWDFAPLKIIAEEAGARFFDFQGRNTIYGGNCFIAAPGLEREARRLLCA
jgi:histidinol phosphatase-like enzyme (inositol monophosphatase family)